MALGVAVGKIIISILSAYAIVFFRFPLPHGLLLADLHHPDAAGRGPHPADLQGVVANLGLLDTYAGLILPLIASATATLLFRQFFLTIPDELVEAARIDGAGAVRFFKDILLPLSPHQHRGAVRHPVHLRLDPVSLAAAGHDQAR